jgi:hypothetical protein
MMKIKKSTFEIWQAKKSTRPFMTPWFQTWAYKEMFVILSWYVVRLEKN